MSESAVPARHPGTGPGVVGRGSGPGDRAVILALGSNLGDRLANLQAGLDLLCRSLRCRAVSDVYETTPAGGPPQGDYLNAVLAARSQLPARDILAVCHQVESRLGRTRSVRWGPRTLDIDVIVCGDEVSADPLLTLPHPRAHERPFVLVPWLDVDPLARLPGDGTVAARVASIGTSGLRRLDGPRLTVPRTPPR